MPVPIPRSRTVRRVRTGTAALGEGGGGTAERFAKGGKREHQGAVGGAA